MDFATQMELIRKRHSEKHNRVVVSNDNQKRIKAFADKYAPLLQFNRVLLASTRIVRYIKKHLIEDCYYDNDFIPGLYKFRILFTNHHLLVTDFDDSDPELSRSMNMSLHEGTEETILFRFCFHIDEIYKKRNDVILVNNLEIILKEDDIVRLERNWRKVCSDTSENTIFISEIEFQKSLVADQIKNPDFLNSFINKYS